MKLLSIVALIITLSSAAFADSRTIRNSDGTTRGTITRSGDSETIRNEYGEIVYTCQRSGDTWSFRNSDGELELEDNDE